MRVIMLGTCSDSQWRDQLKGLVKNKDIDWFDPVVENWDPTDQLREFELREQSGLIINVITPLMSGIYSIAELIDDSNKFGKKVIFCILPSDTVNGRRHFWTDEAKSSFDMIAKMAENNGAVQCRSLEEIATFLNTLKLG